MAEWTVEHILELIHEQLDGDEMAEVCDTLKESFDPSIPSSEEAIENHKRDMALKKALSEKEGMAFIRRELLEKDLSAPLGGHLYYGDEQPLPYKWVGGDETLEIFFTNRWLEAVSTDWDFDEREESPEKASGNSLRDNVVDELTEHFCAERYENNFLNHDEAREEAKRIADCLFDVLKIDSRDQDKTDYKVTVIKPIAVVCPECEYGFMSDESLSEGR